MIPKELDDLIKEYLTDGIISQAERNVLLRKAEKMGLDLDEIDLYITAQEQKVDNKVAAEKKAAIGKVCPMCGKQVESMTVRCDCGYEFKNEKALSSVQKFYEDLNNIALTESEMSTTAYTGANNNTRYDEEKVEKLRYQKKIDLISTFPVPNTKEDIIEFLALAVPNSKLEGGIWWGTKKGRVKLLGIMIVVTFVVVLIVGLFMPFDPLDVFQAAGLSAFFVGCYSAMAFFGFNQSVILRNSVSAQWRAKFDQVLMKGRSLRGDAEFQQQLDYYENIINKQ